MPRFSQELFDLIIDEAAAEDNPEDWPRTSLVPPELDTRHPADTARLENPTERRTARLEACSLVSQGWYHRAAKHLWRDITIFKDDSKSIAGLLRILADRPGIAQLIKNVELQTTRDYVVPQEEDTFVVEVACMLSPIPSLGLVYGMLEGGPFPDGNSLLRHPLTHAVTLFCSPGTLTSLKYEGEFLPTGVLEDLANLRHLSLQGPPAGKYRKPLIAAEPSFEAVAGPLPFQLRIAHFCSISSDALGPFVEHHPHVFSQLAELFLEDLTPHCSPMAGDYDEETLVPKLLILAKDTLESVVVEIEIPLLCLENVFSHPSSLEFPRLKNLTIRVVGCLEIEEEEWTQLRGYLDVHLPSLCQSLQQLELCIGSNDYHNSSLDNPSHIAWRTMKTYLGQDRLPFLKVITLRCTWVIDRMEVEADELADEQKRGDDRAQELERRIRPCLPSWDGDSRGVDIRCIFSVRYGGFTAAEEGYNAMIYGAFDSDSDYY